MHSWQIPLISCAGQIEGGAQTGLHYLEGVGASLKWEQGMEDHTPASGIGSKVGGGRASCEDIRYRTKDAR